MTSADARRFGPPLWRDGRIPVHHGRMRRGRLRADNRLSLALAGRRASVPGISRSSHAGARHVTCPYGAHQTSVMGRSGAHTCNSCKRELALPHMTGNSPRTGGELRRACPPRRRADNT